MSSYEAFKFGFDVAILEKEINSPAGQLTKKEFIGTVDDKKLLRKFSDSCDVITLENEFIDHHILEYLESLGKKVIPSPHTISLIQDKFIQKKTLNKKKIPVPAFIKVEPGNSYSIISSALGRSFILKSRKMGYDGYGNRKIITEKQFISAIDELTKRHSEVYAEELIPFKMELAVIVVRTRNELKTYPVVQTIQKNHICHTVLAPAKISTALSKSAEKIAVDCVKAVDGIGVFGVEMFLTSTDKILVNEMAPRVHNSGHYTIEACVTSQFENHIRAVLNLPLGSTEMVKKYAVMINLLGKKEGNGVVEDYTSAVEFENIKVHIYGKEKSRIGRKMGHITIIGDDLSNILSKAKHAEKKLII